MIAFLVGFAGALMAFAGLACCRASGLAAQVEREMGLAD